jgi:hypothetical protein
MAQNNYNCKRFYQTGHLRDLDVGLMTAMRARTSYLAAVVMISSHNDILGQFYKKKILSPSKLEYLFLPAFYCLPVRPGPNVMKLFTSVIYDFL